MMINQFSRRLIELHEVARKIHHLEIVVSVAIVIDIEIVIANVVHGGIVLVVEIDHDVIKNEKRNATRIAIRIVIRIVTRIAKGQTRRSRIKRIKMTAIE